MAFVKKIVSCKCGRNFYFEFGSDMEVEDLTVSSKCPSCGNGLYVSVSSMGSSQAPSASAQEQPAGQVFPPIPGIGQQADAPSNDWNIEELEHAPGTQAQESAQASSVSSGEPLELGKKPITSSKSSAINDAMNDLFKEE